MKIDKNWSIFWRWKDVANDWRLTKGKELSGKTPSRKWPDEVPSSPPPLGKKYHTIEPISTATDDMQIRRVNNFPGRVFLERRRLKKSSNKENKAAASPRSRQARWISMTWYKSFWWRFTTEWTMPWNRKILASNMPQREIHQHFFKKLQRTDHYFRTSIRIEWCVQRQVLADWRQRCRPGKPLRHKKIPQWQKKIKDLRSLLSTIFGELDQLFRDIWVRIRWSMVDDWRKLLGSYKSAELPQWAGPAIPDDRRFCKIKNSVSKKLKK